MGVTLKMKKQYLFIIALLFSIMLVSAWEFDNVKSYEPISREITIKDSVLGIPTTTVGTVRLINYSRYCMPDDCYAYYQMFHYENGVSFKGSKYYRLDKVTEIQGKTNKYEIFNPNAIIQKPIYDYVCREEGTILANKTSYPQFSCENKLIGYKNISGAWESYNPLTELKAGLYILREKVDIKPGEKVEIIPNFYGIDIDEWIDFVGYSVYEYFNNTAGGGLQVFDQRFYCQSFTVGTVGLNETHTMVGFQRKMKRYGSPDIIDFFIKATDGAGKPTGANLSTGTYNGTEISTSFEVVNISMSHANLTAGTQYAMCAFMNGGAENTNAFEFEATGSGGYSGGAAIYSADRGASYTVYDSSPNYDMWFFEYGSSSAPAYVNVTLSVPADNYQSTSSDVTFNCSAEGENPIQNISLFIDSVLNYTVSDGVNNFTSLETTLSFRDDGDYSWHCYAIDTTFSTDTSDTRTLSVDTTPPDLYGSINLSNISTQNLPVNSTWIINASDSHLSDCYYNTSDNATMTIVTCNSTVETTWLTDGEKFIYFCANDTYGYENCSSRYIDVWYYGITQLSNKNITAEGNSVTFTLYINSTGINSEYPDTSAFLTINNTNYTSSKYSSADLLRFEKTISIPDGWGNSTGNLLYWNWTFNISNGASVRTYESTDYENLTVYSVEIDNCTTYATVVLNYTLYDEEYKSNTLPTALANQSIEVDVSLSKDSIEWNYSVKQTSTNNVRICVPNELLNNSNYNLDSIARYKSDFHVVEFNYIDTYNLTNSNHPQHIHLYDLYSETDRSEYSTSFLVNYQDENYLPVQNAIVDLWRYYVGDGEFLSVEHGKTDADGNTRLHFVTEDVRYKAYVRVGGELVYTSPEFLALCQATPCQINLQKESGVSPIGNYTQVDNLVYSVDLDKSSKTVTFTYSTVDGSSASMRLNVTRFNAYVNDTVCSDSATSSGGTLSCTVPDSAINTTYFVSISKDGQALPTYMFDLNPNAYDNFGYTGVIMTAILYLTLVLMAISGGGIAVLAFGFIGLVVAVLLTLFSGGSIIGVGSSLMWLLVAIIIVGIKVSKRRGG